MKKAVRITLFTVIGLVVAFLIFRAWTKSHSPAKTVVWNQEGLTITTAYSSPAKKGREVFGQLVPYGKVWRTGANEATVVEFSGPVKVAGKELNAGKYSLWSIPTASDWTIIINDETGQWGTSYNEQRDVLRVSVPSTRTTDLAEQFDISLIQAPGGADMILHWENTRVAVPIRK